MQQSEVKTVDDYRFNILYYLIFRNIIKLLKLKVIKLQNANEELEKKVNSIDDSLAGTGDNFE